MDNIEQPLNANERYLYGICVRLDALIHMLSSVIEVMADKQGIAVEDNTVKTEVTKSKKK